MISHCKTRLAGGKGSFFLGTIENLRYPQASQANAVTALVEKSVSIVSVSCLCS